MIKKVVLILTWTVFIILILIAIALTTTGIKTNKFNNFIEKKINQDSNKINIKLDTIKFKFDIEKISLFLEAKNPKINYRDTFIPAKNVKVYLDFFSLINLEPKIKKMNLVLQEIDINQLKKLSSTIKPSNLKSFINNKIQKGKLILNLEIYLNENNLLENFIARGSVSKLNAEIINNFNIKKANFNFFADKTDILVTNIFGELDIIKIKNGDLKLKLSPEISLETNFQTNFNYNKKTYINYDNLIKNLKYIEDVTTLEAELNNNLTINFDKTYKVKKYDYRNNGKILKAIFDFKKPIIYYLAEEKISQLLLVNSKINNNYSSRKIDTIISGKYALNNGKLLPFNLKNTTNRDLFKLKLDFKYNKDFKIDFINYQKAKDSVADIFINFEKQKKKFIIKKANLREKNNLISVEGIEFNKEKFLSLKKIEVKTLKDKKKNNDFSILYGKDIVIKGNLFDASNLPKLFKQSESKNRFLNISKNIQVDFTNIIAPLSENLKNFKLIGEIKKGKFKKISSKGDFGNNNFLDISMKEDKISRKKYLEIYSDLTKPLLTEYNFFEGLSGGKLLYTSVIDGKNSTSKLKIENFKVTNAPGMIKLLTLADLGGLADLAEGEGISFDVLEIVMDKANNLLKFNEILALGPSISVLMNGYKDSNNITSIRGTLIPAKTLNKIISKIPLLGNIIVPKEVGEGLFGISFKMKGPPGKIKTSINPLKTITPRFIQKIVEKKTK